MSQAACEIFPQAKVTISMGHWGDFRLAGANWQIILSRGGEVAGTGQVPTQSYHLFIERLSERLAIPLIPSDPVDLEHGCLSP